MRAYSFSEFIARPRSDVWTALTDLTVAPRWRPSIASMETVGGVPLNLGVKVKIVIEFLGKRTEHVSVTSAYEPNVRWELHSSSSPSVEGWFDFRLTDETGGTRVVATCELKAHSLMNWLLLPLIARGERTRRAEMLLNLKRFVESGNR